MLKYISWMIVCGGLLSQFSAFAIVPFVHHKKKFVQQYKKQNNLTDQIIYRRENKSVFYFITIYPARQEDYSLVVKLAKGHPFTRMGNAIYLGPIYQKQQLKQLIHAVKGIGLFNLQTINAKKVYALKSKEISSEKNEVASDGKYYQDKSGETISFRGPTNENFPAVPFEQSQDYFDSASIQFDYNKMYVNEYNGNQLMVRGEAKYKYAWELWDFGLGAKGNFNREIGTFSHTNQSLSFYDSYVAYAPGDLVFTGGFLHVDWGRMENASVINQLSRNDRSRGEIDSSNEQAMASFILRLEYFLDQQQNRKIDVILVPKIQRNYLPREGSIWHPVDSHNLAVQGIGSNPRLERFVKVGKISISEESSRAFGLRFSDRDDESFDYAWNLIYYGDLDPYVHLSRPFVEDLNRPEVEEAAAIYFIHKQNLISLSYRPHTLIGFDFSQDLQNVLWKGEVAYITNNYLTRKNYTLVDSDKIEMATSWHWPWKGPNINLQLQLNAYHYFSDDQVFDHTTDFSLTSKMQFVWARELYALEPLISWSLIENGKMVGTKFYYKGMDNLDFYSYWLHFMGPRSSQMGFAQNNSLVGLGLKMFF